jgi:hypothetical protein
MECPFCQIEMPRPEPSGSDAICIQCGRVYRFAGFLDVWFGDTRELWLLKA